MKILIIEDNEEISESLRSGLEEECFVVDVAEDGEKGVKLALRNDYNLIMLDYMLPKKDGQQVCREIREKKKDIYIMIMSVKSEIPTKVDFFEIGADDYIIKPFSFSEMMARIKAVLRRPPIVQSELIELKNFVLDIKNHLVLIKNREIYLTRKESMILETLAKNKGKVVSRTLIFEEAWDSEADFFSNAIEMHIRNLRKKLGNNNFIRTLPGRGYMLE